MAVMRGRIVTLKEAANIADTCRAQGQRLVLTNGHFDLLHVGHALYLEEAKQLGDILFVGVNDDASAAKLKGPKRPLVPEVERATLLTCLRSVDYAVIFSSETAVPLLQAIRPDIYVKGGDYNLNTLPEADAALAVGATVRFIPLVPEHSTSALIQRIVSRYSA